MLTIAVLAIFIFRTGRYAIESEKAFWAFCLNASFVACVTFFVMSLACIPLQRLAFPDANESRTRLNSFILLLWFAQNLGILLLFIAICGVGSSGYYVFLRYFIGALAVVCAICSFNFRTYIWAAIFVVVAILFNPFTPFQLGRLNWMIIDWLLIALLVYNPIANAFENSGRK